jgi:hypothetical protein
MNKKGLMKWKSYDRDIIFKNVGVPHHVEHVERLTGMRLAVGPS